MWSKSKECSDLFFNYIPSTYQTSTPIIMSGIDCQLIGYYAARNFKKEVNNFLLSENIPMINDEKYLNEFLPLIDSIILYNKRDSSEYNLMIQYLDIIIAELKPLQIEQDFMFLCLI